MPSPQPDVDPVTSTGPLAGDEIVVEVEAAAVTAYELLGLARRRVAAGGACVGVVVEAGPAADDHVGRRVVVGPVSACGECDACRRGRLAVCPAGRWLGRDVDGALAGRVTARRRWACPLDGPLAEAAPGPEAAALPREAALAYALWARAGVAPGEVAVWLGDGPVAAFGVDIARARGAHALVPTTEERTFAPDELLASLRRRADAAGGSAFAWKVFEVSARPGWRRRALALAGATGGLAALAAAAIVGVDDDEAHALDALVDGEGAVVGVTAPHPDLLPELAAMVAKRELDLGARVRVAPTAELPAEVERMRRGQAPDSLLVVRSER